MKAELIKRLEELLQTEDITSIKQEVREIRNDFEAETAKETQIQREQFEAAEQEEGSMFEYVPSAEDEQFLALVTSFKERIKEQGRLRAEEEKRNLDVKSALLDEFEKLIKTEENIKAAFDGFNAFKEKFDATGDVPGDRYNDIRERYQHLKDDFFYNINIYKELQQHDLKKNQQLKEELTAKARDLVKLEGIREMDTLVRAYQKEWSEIGPSPRETYKEMADEFFGICREVIEKVRAHYDGLREEQEANLAKKVELVDKMKEILSMELKQHSAWTKKTEEVLELQKGWKVIGFAPKKENEAVWQEFRGLCDLFFERKGAYYEERRNEQKKNQEAKEALIEKAKSLQDSTDWKSTTDAFLKLQQEWKKAGPASPRDEQKLWQRFRAACDTFFNAKKQHFSGMGDRQEENLKQKEALIAEIEAFTLSGQKATDIAALKAFSERFNSLGYVPRAKVQEVFDRYHAALDAKYSSIDMGEEERRILQFKGRIQNIKSSDDGDRQLRKERRLMLDKIDRLKERVMQYENNMGIFTGSGAEAMRKEIEKKIKAAEREIEEIHQKLDLLEG